jgi:diguanylate cyclase (GGDEF)-like protein
MSRSFARSAARRPWIIYAALAAAGVAIHLALPAGELIQSAWYDVVGGSAVLAILAGILIHRPARPLPWLLLALGNLLFVVGDVLWTVLEELTGDIPYPSVADLAYLAGYPFLVVALLISVGLRIRGGDRAALLDGAILATSASVVGWLLLMEPAITSAVDLDPAGLAVSLAYPIVDLLILGVVLTFVATPGARSVSVILLVASFVSIFVADVVFALQVAEETYVDGGALDAFWLVAYALIGVSALHPSMRQVATPHPVPVVWLGPVRLLALGTAMLAGPVILLVNVLSGDRALVVVAAGALLLALFVLIRLALVVRTLAADVAARRELERELSFQAAHDPLTGLSNRRRFVERLQDLIGAAESPTRPRPRIALLFLDLDDFKTVNDTLGHGAGDELLTMVAARLTSLVRPGDVAARLGGDEFGVVLVDADITMATAIADRLLEALRDPLEIAGQQVIVRASVGIADGGRPGITAEDLVRDADVAMYQAKAMGKGRAQVFAPSMHATALDRLQLQADLEHALAASQFRLVYQPIVEIATGRIRIVEALVRWAHPERGLLGPHDFIGLAEETGAIVGLGRWLLTEAIRDVVRWRREADPELAVSVNLSPRQLTDAGLVDDVRGALASAGLPGAGLVLEVTESMLVEDGELPLENLVGLRKLGVRVAIDDFGTGYSSLSYLQRLPADVLKIDREFVAQLTGKGDGGVLAKLIIGLGETLKLETVAEGVDDAAQLEALRRLGCRLAQGDHLARPESAERIAARLRKTTVIDEAPEPERRRVTDWSPEPA